MSPTPAPHSTTSTPSYPWLSIAAVTANVTAYIALLACMLLAVRVSRLIGPLAFLIYVPSGTVTFVALRALAESIELSLEKRELLRQLCARLSALSGNV